MAGEIGLACILKSDTSSQSVFRVSIHGDKLVEDLREGIKAKKHVALANVDASDLRVWMLNTPISFSDKHEFSRQFEQAVSDLAQYAKLLEPLDPLSDHLTTSPPKRCLHIIVDVFSADYPRGRLQTADSPPIIRLNCLVLGESISHAFPIKIVEAETVGALKVAIKEQKKHKFEHVDADALNLWKVPPALENDLENFLEVLSTTINSSDLADDDQDDQVSTPHVNNKRIQSLSPLQELSKVFSEPPVGGHVHIVVTPPPSLSTVEGVHREKEDIVTALRNGYDATVKKARNAKSPSESAKSKEYRVYQRNSPIYDGRYDNAKSQGTTALPIQLYHPVFAHFLDDLSSNSLVPPNIAKATVNYMKAASAIYENEGIRRQFLQPRLCEILAITFSAEANADRTSPDGMFLVNPVGELSESALVLLKEDKNELGDGGCDPSTQAGLSAVRFWVQNEHDEVRKQTCCPTFLIATAGAWFAVLGAAFTDKWIVQRLTDFIWVGLSATLDEPHYDRVARIMNSLRKNVWKLYDYYRGLNVVATVPNGLHPRYFPSVRAYGDVTSGITTFDYIQPLEIESTCVTFLARTTPGTPKPIVVKFVQRYGEDAHRLLAKENLAPALIYCGHISAQGRVPSYGHLRMVVMEYIDGDTLDKAKRIPRKSRDEIRRALDLLHKSGYVFGDLRQPNVMITKNQETKLIDFDWAGKHDTDRYPLLISCNLPWPVGVEALSLMQTSHDDEMFTRLFPKSNYTM